MRVNTYCVGAGVLVEGAGVLVLVPFPIKMPGNSYSAAKTKITIATTAMIGPALLLLSFSTITSAIVTP